MRAALWPDAQETELREEALLFLKGEAEGAVFVAELSGEVVGFIEISLRSYVEGCTSSPVPHVEAWFVLPHRRGRGIGRDLMNAAEEWSRKQGYTELGSDANVGNLASQKAHTRLGFEKVETIVVFRKPLI